MPTSTARAPDSSASCDSRDQTHFLTGLPPILSNYVVLGSGFARGEDQDLWAANPAPCTLAKVYAQAVIIDGQGLGFSGLVQLALPTCGSDAGGAAAGK